MTEINNIVIVGGGSAGFMTATTLLKVFPNKKITLIESPNINTIGVGESTLGRFKQWLALIGIGDEFMKHCNATYKFGIRFTNFYREDSGYFDYPFGRPENIDFPLNLWHLKRISNPSTKVTDYADSYFPIQALINTNKVVEKLDGFNFETDVAYHFNAVKFAEWLKNNVCLPNGLIHIESEVKKININEDGIESLELDNGDKITSDLFIDCTGFKSLLLGETLNEEFVPYDHILPNNKAWATHIDYTDKKKQLVPFTNCTAIGNGWVWNIPLWENIGTGYVYSDKFISDKEALNEFKEHLEKTEKYDIKNCEFRNIPMKIGIYKRLFVKNVCAIGLSAGFIEPLESNGLLTVHEFLYALVNVLKRGKISQWDRDTFTFKCRHMFNTFAEFVSLHYALSHRDSTEYWKQLQETVYDKGIYNLEATQNQGFRTALLQKLFDNDFLVSENLAGWHCIAVGMNWNPLEYETLQYRNITHQPKIDQELIKKLDERKKGWEDTLIGRKERDLTCCETGEVTSGNEECPDYCDWVKIMVYSAKDCKECPDEIIRFDEPTQQKSQVNIIDMSEVNN